MAMSSKGLLIISGALLLAGCSGMNKNIGMEDPSLGETVKYNAAIQTVNPDPAYPAGSAQAGDSGVKAAAAVKRYRTDAVKQVEVMQTTGGSGSPR
jgi:starvation-inducible outer membrane lipoprotein